MKKIIVLLLLSIFAISVGAVDYQVTLYPDTNKVEVVTTNVADTVTVVISNLSLDAITGFYLTINSDDSVDVLENIIDGNANPTITTEVNDGIIYLNQLSTSLIIGTVGDTVRLKFYTLNSENMHFTFCGQQPFGFFGIVEPQVVIINCCHGIRGNIDNDAQDLIDISDLVYFIDYSFGIPTGPKPVCFEEADVNVSGQLDISDIVHVVDYMFSIEGNIPPAPCP